MRAESSSARFLFARLLSKKTSKLGIFPAGGRLFKDVNSAMSEFFQSIGTALYNTLIVQDRWFSLLHGLGITLIITLAAIVLGTLLGIIFCLLKLSKNKFLRGIAHVYIEVIRGTPTVVQLLLIYYGIFGSVDLNKILVAIIAFGINSGAYVAEIIRAGILSVDHGQMEAGRSLGLGYWPTMFTIILPQAVKNILPTYTSEFIVLLKETSIVGYIALVDLTKAGDQIRSDTFDAYTPLIIVALLYLCMTLTLAKIFGILERRLRKSDIR